MKDKIKIQNTEINFRKSLKAKNISIRIKPFEGVLVAVPRFLSFKIANDFVESKMNWIQKNLLKYKVRNNYKRILKIGSVFHTKFHSIFIDSTSEIKNTFKRKQIHKNLYFRKKKEIHSIESQDYIRNIIEQILRIEAKSYLPKRVDELAKKHNFTYQKLAIKNTKTRWGSCSFKIT